MLSIKRLAGILGITLFISIIFLAYILSDNSMKKLEIENTQGSKSEIMEASTDWETAKASVCLVGEENQIRENAEKWLSKAKIPYKKTEKIEAAVLEDAIYVFCQEKIEQCVNVRVLGDFINGGGKVLFAAGLSEGYTDSYLNPIIGIVEKGIRENYTEFSVEPGFLPFYQEQMKYPGFSASTWLKLRDDAEIYMKDAVKGVPILYSYLYGKGRSVVVNGDFLKDFSAAGMLAGALGILQGDFIYPVMGTKSVFLDNFPVAANADDSECMKRYGRSTEAFVRDKMWPVFEGMGVRNEMKYTSSILTAATGERSYPAVNDSLFYSISKSSLLYGGEVVFSGTFDNEGDLSFYEAFETGFSEIFPKYRIKGFSVLWGNPGTVNLEKLKERYPDVKVVRSYYEGDSKSRFVTDVEERDGLCFLPVISEGSSLDASIWDLSMGISSMGLMSHRFDIDSMLGLSETTDTWEENQRNLEEFEKRVYQNTKWLESFTLSDMQMRIEGALSLEFQWEKQGSSIRLNTNHMAKGQCFYLRTPKEIASVKGAEYEKVAENYYLLRVQDLETNILFEE